MLLSPMVVRPSLVVSLFAKTLHPNAPPIFKSPRHQCPP
jgi:hypothetical protein